MSNRVWMIEWKSGSGPWHFAGRFYFSKTQAQCVAEDENRIWKGDRRSIRYRVRAYAPVASKRKAVAK
jgi:hypothetical protein